MTYSVHNTAYYIRIKLLSVHDQLTTRLDDPERVLKIGPVF